MRLLPVDTVTPAELAAGERDLVIDSAWASLTGAWSGGVVLAAFALALGAGPLVIGLLAAIPMAAQLAQLPAIGLVERVRQRKRIGVGVITASRVILLGMVAVPFVDDPAVAIGLLVAAQIAIAVAGSIGACCINSWLHQLIPQERRGVFYSRRLLWGTLLGGIGSLVAGQWIERMASRDPAPAYAVVFLAAALASFLSSYYLARAPEPRMPPRPAGEGAVVAWRQPLHDRNFRRLLVFLAAWTVASNIAAPFLTVFLLRQLGLGLGTVTMLGVASQLANVAALYVWGRVSTGLPNKSVLAVALPAYFACTALLVFADQPANAGLALALLAVLHVAMGAATGGIALATGNLGLKLAPMGQGTSYLAMIGLVTAIAGGLAPLVAGGLAEWLAGRELALVVHWTAPALSREFAVVSFAHWEFLFIASALAGLYVMHALSRVHEDGRASERQVMRQFAVEAGRAVGNLSSIAGAVGGLYPFRRLHDLGRRARERVHARASAAIGRTDFVEPEASNRPPVDASRTPAR